MINKEIFMLDASLRNEGVSEDDIQFINDLIRRDRRDENLIVTPNNIDARLEQRTPGLSTKFHRASETAGIKWGPHYPNED